MVDSTHIQPPMAQVPIAIRELTRLVPLISMYSCILSLSFLKVTSEPSIARSRDRLIFINRLYRGTQSPRNCSASRTCFVFLCPDVAIDHAKFPAGFRYAVQGLPAHRVLLVFRAGGSEGCRWLPPV